MGAFQMAQMKHRDARVSAMCKHLRDAITLWEEIQLYPFEKPEPEPAPPSPPPPTIQVLPSEKLAYSINEAAIALSVGRTTLWRAIKDKKLATVKFGNRRLIPVDALRAWIATLKPKK